MDKKTSIVMVIEDEELLLDAITRKLKSSGISVVSCKGGKQALQMLTQAKNLPDAIWLDYYLKDMNGLEFMSTIKANDKWLNIPTIVVSNSASPDKVKSMLTLGVKMYYLKAENRLDDIITYVKGFIKQENNSKKNE